ncbi:hypothetical protein [Caldichromatium japonicum]|nr:hypothetical protein [Caldichromatium japonicum]
MRLILDQTTQLIEGLTAETNQAAEVVLGLAEQTQSIAYIA